MEAGENETQKMAGYYEAKLEFKIYVSVSESDVGGWCVLTTAYQ